MSESIEAREACLLERRRCYDILALADARLSGAAGERQFRILQEAVLNGDPAETVQAQLARAGLGLAARTQETSKTGPDRKRAGAPGASPWANVVQRLIDEQRSESSQ